MRYKLIVGMLLLLCADAKAQHTYRAVYTYNISYDLASIYQETYQKNIRLNNYDSTDTPEEQHYKKLLEKEMQKKLYNRNVLTVICAPHGQYVELTDSPARDIRNSDMVDVVQAEPPSTRRPAFLVGPIVALFMSFSKDSKLPDTVYQVLDTVNARIVPTGMVKEINHRICYEYVSGNNVYKGISLWLDPQLPSYVSPGLWFGLGGKGGVVAVTFSKSQLVIQLESIKGTTEKVVMPKVPQRPSFRYNPLGYRIRDLE
ncbi:MAG: hypothetical protein EOO06_00565 [Chitinophagaceae bacterium]|nr:MAG: hypothetical protein EOO06_00565 [Chitinophagaceae bacterium]